MNMVDWWKLIISLNTGVLTLTATFYKQFGDPAKRPGLLICSWIFQVLSLFAAMLKLWSYLAGNKGAGGSWEGLREWVFWFGSGPGASFFADLFFLLGLVFLLIFATVNVWRN